MCVNPGNLLALDHTLADTVAAGHHLCFAPTTSSTHVTLRIYFYKQNELILAAKHTTLLVEVSRETHPFLSSQGTYSINRVHTVLTVTSKEPQS